MANSYRDPSSWGAGKPKWEPYDATKDKVSPYYKPPSASKPKPPAASKPKEDYIFVSSVPTPNDDEPNYVTSGGSGGGSGGGSSYESLLAKYEQEQKSLLAKYEQEQKRAAEEALRAQEAAREAAYNSGAGALNTSSAEALRQAYINKMRTETAMPQQTAMMGAGGLSESTLASLNAGYGNDRANIEAAKLEGLAGLKTQLAQGSAGDVSAYQNNIMGIAQQSMQAQLAYRQKLEDIARQERYTREEREYEQAKQAASRGIYGGGSGGSGGSSVSNVLKAPESDVLTPQAIQFDLAMSNRINTNPANKYLQQDKINDEIAYAIQSQLNSGILTVEDARMLAQKYGINIQ